MGHHIAWDNNEKTVVVQQYLPPASKADLFQLAEKSAEMLKTVPYNVHLILDERAIKLIPSAADLQHLEKLVPNNQGAVVVVVPKKDVAYKLVTQRLGQIVAPRSVNQTYFAASIEEARTLLQQKVAVRYP